MSSLGPKPEFLIQLIHLLTTKSSLSGNFFQFFKFPKHVWRVQNLSKLREVASFRYKFTQKIADKVCRNAFHET